MREASRRMKWTVAILSPIVFFGLIEVALRIADFRYEPGLAEASKPPRELKADVDVYVPDPETIWRLRPSSTLQDRGHGFLDVHTNSLGLRGEEPPGERRPGEVRVLCLGDSVTFGLGVRDDETYPARLQEALRRSPELAGRPVTVLNAGVPGWSVAQAMRERDRLSWFEPDFVVFWLGMNDVQVARGFPDSKHMELGGAIRDRVSFLHRLRVVQIVEKVADSARGGNELPTRASVDEFGAAVAELERQEAAGGPKAIFVRYPDQMDRTRAQIRGVVEEAEKLGAKRVAGPARLIHHTAAALEGTDLTGRLVEGVDGPVLVFGEAQEGATVEEMREKIGILRKWKYELGLRLALLPETALGRKDFFDDLPPDDVFVDNVHLTAEGNRLAAQAIATRILEALGK